MAEEHTKNITSQRDDNRSPRSVLVLIAEDEEPIAEIIATIIREMDATPIIASHGREAFALAQQSEPALVITDLMMPLMDGAQLIAALRAKAAESGVQAPPVILMTASGLENANSIGADAFLPKPFDLEVLEALLRRYLVMP
jgi:DNA-binding response OmpR family regulator